MKRIVLWLLAVAAAAALAGCGGKSAEGGSATSSASAASANPSVSRYDAGPRAGESPADRTQAERGEQLFKDKGCSACHAFGTRLSGPDLKGVSLRRTAQWMEQQILHPEVMAKEDPISRKLVAENALQMPNQKVAQDEARAVIEYLKHKDRESGEPDE